MKQNGQLERYLSLHRKYLNDAEELIKKNDYSQASEKAWGAIATLVKALATLRKKHIKSHEGIIFFLTSIANELKDKSILNIIYVAESLHYNFYENVLTPEAVRHGTKTIKQLSKRLKTRFALPA